MKLLLTGGSGFIGQTLQDLLREGYTVKAPSSSVLDVTDESAVAQYIKTHHITHVIHAATVHAARRAAREDELSQNLKMFYALANCAGDLDRILYFGSGAEFDKRFAIDGAKEEDFGQTVPTLNDYSLSKFAMNQLKDQYQNIYNLRLFGLYGKYENKEACFVSHLCRCVQQQVEMTIRQDCVFDFLYAEDLLQPLLYLLQGTPRYRDYNLCSGAPVRLSQIAMTLQEVTGSQLPITCLQEGEGLCYTGSNRRIKAEVDWQITPHREGLLRFYRDYCKGEIR